MGRIPSEFIPSRIDVAQRIYLLPELHYPEKLNIVRDFYERVNKDKIIIYHKEERIKLSEMRRSINKLANGLKSLGAEPNDRILVRGPNCPHFMYAQYACWAMGAIPVPVSSLLRSDELAYRANDLEARFFIVGSDAWLDMDKAPGKFHTIEKIIVFGERKQGYLFYDDLIEDQSEEDSIEKTSRHDIGRILYSSGTTGMSKGIINRIDDLCSMAEGPHKYALSLAENDVVGGWAVFTFALGATSLLLPARIGCAISIVNNPTPEEMFETIAEHKITVLRCAPTFYRMMLEVEDAESRYDLSSLRLCGSAGEPLSGTTRLTWRKRFGVDLIDWLGSGEMGCVIAQVPGAPEEKFSATGKLLPGIRARIVNEKFHDVHNGESGELLIQGPVAQEYWRKPEVQKKAAYKGWNRLGLIYQKDGDGYYWYKGRSDDMIVTSGYKIPGGEVEAVLLTHEAVSEAAVVPSPDPIRGYVIKAFIVLKKGYEPSEALKKELQDYVKANLEPYKYPRKIDFVASFRLPRTITGKIQRNMLRDIEEQGLPLGFSDNC